MISTMRRALAVLLIGAVTTIAWLTFGGGWSLAGSDRADPDDPEQVGLGRQVYAANCASCHGASLEGQPDWKRALPDGTLPAPPHDESGHTWHHPDQLLFDYTKRGGAAVVGGSFKSNMPGFGDQLTDDEIWAVIAFIKSRWSPPVRQRQAERSNG
jgi:mono/diheme cytochrome c family protein